MTKLITQRLILGIFTLFLVSILIFFAAQVLPGDAASAILGQDATPESLAALREVLGLNQPVYIRYVHWIHGFITGDLGVSLANQQSVIELIKPRFINTILLAFLAAIVAIPLAIVLGLLCVINRGGMLDKIINVIALAFVSLPEYFLGLILIIFLSIKLEWLPSLSSTYEGMGLVEWLKAMALPTLTLALITIAQIMRMTRTAVLGVMDQPYIETAFLKGIRLGRVINRHALPNAAAPIINIVAYNIAYLITGVVLVEAIFNYDGLGRFMVDAVSKRDLPLVQAAAMIFGATYVLMNMFADIAAIAVNPRLRHPR